MTKLWRSFSVTARYHQSSFDFFLTFILSGIFFIIYLGCDVGFGELTQTQIIIIIIIILFLIIVAYLTGFIQKIGVFGQLKGKEISEIGTEALEQAKQYAMFYNTNFIIEKQINLTKVLYKEELEKLTTEIPQLSSTDLVCNKDAEVYTSDEVIIIDEMQLNKLYCAKLEPSSCVWCKGDLQFDTINIDEFNKNCCDVSKMLLENVGLRQFLLYIIYPTEERIYMALIDVNGDVFHTTIDWDLQNRVIVSYEQRTYFNNINYLRPIVAPGWSRLSLKRLFFYVKDIGNTYFVDKLERNPVKQFEGENFNAVCAGEEINIRIYSKRVDVKVFSAVRITDDFKIKYRATVYIMNKYDV